MVGRFGEVLVLDWGVARVIGAADEAAAPGSVALQDGRDVTGGAEPRPRTRGGTVVGTPGFMSPEQARGEAAIGPSADVYALGALLFWISTGDTPSPDAETNQRRLGGLRPTPSRRLRAIILRCLAPAAIDRYQSAADLSADITRFRAGGAVLAHREQPLERLGRWLHTYRTFVLIVTAYLVMRALFAFWMSRS
jgi:serine/threonine protein kinase